jgi:4-amino-4-deoxy-L-arabinose transferase-like glycosyltransferase
MAATTQLLHSEEATEGKSLHGKLGHHVALWVIAACVLRFAWTGFVGSDDDYYVSCGLGWLHSFPFVAQHFGEVRAAVCIPIAITTAILGESEFSAVASTCLFLLGTLSITFQLLSRTTGWQYALAAAATMATIPLFAITGTIPNADVPELFFIAASVALIWRSVNNGTDWRCQFLAGVAAALAFSAHEVSVALLLYFGLLFLLGYGMQRRNYWTIAAGFVAVVAIECIYYLLMTGDALYRFRLTLHGAGIQDRVSVKPFQFTPSGTLHVWSPIDPVIMLFTHIHQFGVLAYLAVPALYWTFHAPSGDTSTSRRMALLFAGLAITWIAFAALALTNQKLLPRYYTVPAFCLFIVVALWIRAAIWPRRPKLAVSILVVFALVDLIGIYVSDTNPRMAERELVRYLSGTEGVVYADPLTAASADWYCRWSHVDCGRILTGPPPAGSVYFYNARGVAQPSRLVPAAQLRQYQPGPGWLTLWRPPREGAPLTSLLDRAVMDRLLPERIVSKLERRNSVAVYRIPERAQ